MNNLPRLIPRGPSEAALATARGSFVLAKFDWSGNKLDLKMLGRLTIFGGLLDEDPRQYVRDPNHAIRWKSRQAARQAMKRLKFRLILGSGWEVVNLKSVGTR